MKTRTALVLGATGLIGEQLVKLLLQSEEYERVTVLVRASLPYSHPKLHIVIVDYARLEDFVEEIVGQDVFCCLGTTIKKAKTQEAFRKVDLDYPVHIGQIAKRNGAEKYLLVSSIGANKHSRIFYSRIKGEAEEALAAVGFDQYHVFRPSALLGKRKDFRIREKVGILFFPVVSLFMVGPLHKYKPIRADQVAYAMYRIAVSKQDNAYAIWESDQIVNIH
ncbi:oxidoreductase [Paenibacillus sedimenti]|uniref:Oxidoreductase n=1 Tax=Paenibacillus sedimenti TaxID=2770274 RepID=A0A926KWJ8_9BACL|nr:oxidoreductase [Paenibacillus sedimenti]MBD0384201.1 oxidoreductase [Paenibacillus sedimenti]